MSLKGRGYDVLCMVQAAHTQRRDQIRGGWKYWSWSLSCPAFVSWNLFFHKAALNLKIQAPMGPRSGEPPWGDTPMTEVTLLVLSPWISAEITPMGLQLSGSSSSGAPPPLHFSQAASPPNSTHPPQAVFEPNKHFCKEPSELIHPCL